MPTDSAGERRRGFAAPTSARCRNFCPFVCPADGYQAAAIAAVTVRAPSDGIGEDEYIVTPTIVSAGPGITQRDHEGRQA